MDIQTLRLKIFEMNEDETFYKEYYYARQQEYSLKHFLANLDMDYVYKRHLIIPEIKNTIPPQFEDSFFFDMHDPHSIVVQKHNRYSPALLHKHTYFELFYIFSGSCKQHISNRDIELHTGDICIVPPGIEHSVTINDDSIGFNIMIRKSTLFNIFSNFLQNQNILSFFFMNHIYARNANDYIIFHTNKDYEIQRAFLYMYLEDINKEIYHNQMISHTLMLVFGLLIRYYENSVETPAFAHKTDVQRFALLQFIQENYTSVTLDEIAARFHYTPEYTSKLIKETTGMTFTDILQQVRLEKAQDMLANTNLSVASISESVGYSSPVYFIKLFKNYTDMTPSAYRKLHSTKIKA